MGRKRDLAGKHVLITGAASGIGRATAELAALKGAHLYLTDRNAEPLAEVAEAISASGGNVVVSQAADVSSYEQVKALAAAVHQHVPAVDVVMNIAGISTWGTVQTLRHDQWRSIVEVNLMGPIHVIEEFIPPMIKARKGGNLVNVSSAAGLFGFPWHAAYSASKFGLRGISEVLRFDLHRYKIKVSLVVPGAVNTGLVQTLDIAGIDTSNSTISKFRERFTGHAKTPAQAAAAIIKGTERGKYFVYTSRDIHALHLLQRYFPPGYRAIMHGMNAGFAVATRKARQK